VHEYTVERFSAATRSDHHSESIPEVEGSQQTVSRSRLLRAQLGYADRGKLTFPCEGKRPLTRRGFKDATTDPRMIHMWRSRWPLSNIGMPTGERSGVWVLDVDRPEALDELEARIGRLPATARVRTPRGGLHLYFRHVGGVTNSPGGLPAGIDVRGEGGYVLVPPSAGYSWEDRSPAVEAPPELVELVREKGPKAEAKPPASTRAIAGEKFHEGQRNTAMFFEVLNLKDRDMPQPEALGEALAINAARCDPPLPEDEVVKIVKSAYRYPVRGARTPPEVVEVVDGLKRAWWTTRWRGVGGKTERDVLRVLIEFAERYGHLSEDGGARFTLSWRTLALAAACSHRTVSRVVPRLRDAGWIQSDNGGRAEHEAGAFVLLPRPGGTTLSTFEGMHEGGATSAYLPQHTPCFRWRGHVGKGRAGVLYALEAHGSQSKEELAERLGWSRANDLRARYLEPLVGLGLVEDRGGSYALPGDYRERVDEVRNVPYTTVSRRGRESKDGARTVRWVEETENNASEVERLDREREEYEKQRRKRRERLAHRTPEADEECRELLNRMDDEREAAVEVRDITHLRDVTAQPAGSSPIPKPRLESPTGPGEHSPEMIDGVHHHPPGCSCWLCGEEPEPGYVRVRSA